MLGLSCTGGYAHLRPMLSAYSDALGIAYQLKDDMEDHAQDRRKTTHPTAVLALQTEHPTWNQREVPAELQRMIDFYHQQAIDALNGLEQFELKRLLYQVTERILK